MTRLFITGANGFIGKPATRYLADQGHSITAVVRQVLWRHRRIDFIEGDLFCLDRLNIDPGAFDVVIHMAAETGMFEKNNRLYRGNLGLTDKLLRFFQHAGVYWIYFSSIEAFGPTGSRTVDEQNRPDPLTDYGKAKLAVEKRIKAGPFNYALLRIGNAAGDDDGLHHQVRKIMAGRSLYHRLLSFIMVNIISHYELNLVHVTDIAQVLDRLTVLQPDRQTYFITQQPVSLHDLAAPIKDRNRRFTGLLPLVLAACKIASLFKLSNLVTYVAQGMQERPFRRYAVGKIKKDLNLAFRDLI